MKMNKILCTGLVAMTLLNSTNFVYANESNYATESTVDVTSTDLKAEVGTLYYDENHEDGLKNQRAVSKPTSFAPDSYYNGPSHNWSGVTSYTYSSYLFHGGDLDVDATTTFSVAYYQPNGTYIGTINSTKSGSYYQVRGVYGADYYIVIYNNASTTSQNATYKVFTNQLDW